MQSFGMVILIPFILFMWVNVLTNLFIRLKYRLAGHHEQIKYNNEQNETPILVIKFNKQPLKMWLLGILLITLSLACFFCAGIIAHDQQNRLFFSLNEEETYILYYWTWKFNSISLFMLLMTASCRILFTKKISISNNSVIIQNALLGKKSFTLDDNVRCSKALNGLVWLYNELSMKYIIISNKRIRKNLDARQEKLLDEFINKIPEKKKSFYI